MAISGSTVHNTPSLGGGFKDRVHDSQHTFRAVMEALARPGTQQVLNAETMPPKSLPASLASIACTLCDGDTALFLEPSLSSSQPVVEWLAFHTGAPLVESCARSDFALFADAAAVPTLENFALGTQEYPETSTTLIVQVAALDGGRTMTLTGPGIRDKAILAPVGLPDHFAVSWAANKALFPRGVDVLLVSGNKVVGLPRSVTISMEGAG